MVVSTASAQNPPRKKYVAMADEAIAGTLSHLARDLSRRPSLHHRHPWVLLFVMEPPPAVLSNMVRLLAIGADLVGARNICCPPPIRRAAGRGGGCGQQERLRDVCGCFTFSCF